jgi:hypothetical protein
MDSSTLMNHRELQLFMQQYGDRLRSSGKQIFILETVRLEIIRHLGGTDTVKSEKAIACMAVLNEYSDLFVYEGGALPEELVDDAFADPEILAAMTRDKRRYRQLLIASDRGLSMDAVNLNRQYSCHGEPVSVKKIAKSAYIGTAIVGLVSTSILFFLPGTVAALFVKAEDAMLLKESTRAIRLFCFAYLFRWFGVTTQGFLSAIEKPILATCMSVSTALIFPVIILGSLWSFGLDGIWFNFVGVNMLTAALGIILLVRVGKEIKARMLNKKVTAEDMDS